MINLNLYSMRKILYIGSCVGLIVFGACNKNLDQVPPSNTATSNFYTNTSDFTLAVTSAYSKLRAYPDQQLWLGEMRSDNIIITTDGNRDFQGIKNLSPNLTNTGFVVGAWDNDFSGIFNANTVLDKLVIQRSATGLAQNAGSYAPFIILTWCVFMVKYPL
jgi:starch-binding outer membrane protein, SusD/RagB family